MKILLAAVATTGTFTVYPGPNAADPHIEAVTRRGPIYELIVKCRSGTAVVSYSPADDRYCTPRLVCGKNRSAIVAESCGRGK